MDSILAKVGGIINAEAREKRSKAWYNTHMASKELQDFIAARKLIWWVKDYAALDETAIVEATLNYGDWKDVQELIRIMGIERVAEIFHTQMITGRQRGNYHKRTRHYFELYFAHHAPAAHA